MTATRGRVLLINDEMNRKGCKLDFEHLNDLFKQMGFVISSLSATKIWSCKVGDASYIIYDNELSFLGIERGKFYSDKITAHLKLNHSRCLWPHMARDLLSNNPCGQKW